MYPQHVSNLEPLATIISLITMPTSLLCKIFLENIKLMSAILHVLNMSKYIIIMYEGLSPLSRVPTSSN